MGGKKQYIPKVLKEQIWLKYMGNCCRKQCPCCKNNEISAFYFQCGHIISENSGGQVSSDNLVPICGQCNSSMYKTNMFIFMKKMGFSTDEIALIRYGTTIVPEMVNVQPIIQSKIQPKVQPIVQPNVQPDDKNNIKVKHEIKTPNLQEVIEKKIQKDNVEVKEKPMERQIDSKNNNSNVSWCKKADCITGSCKKNGPYENKQKKKYFKYRWSCCGSQAESPDHHNEI